MDNESLWRWVEKFGFDELLEEHETLSQWESEGDEDRELRAELNARAKERMAPRLSSLLRGRFGNHGKRILRDSWTGTKGRG